MHPINVSLVEKLIQEQFPEWAHLEVKPVKFSGHDNRTFHLGDEMSVRLPSDVAYAPQVEKENSWLPILNKGLYRFLPHLRKEIRLKRIHCLGLLISG